MAALAAGTVVACSSSSTGSPDATPDAVAEAAADGPRHIHDAGRDSARDAFVVEAGADVILPTAATVRLANWSPDAPGLDFCIAPHGTGAWSGPVLAQALGGSTSLGAVTVLDAGIPFDAHLAAPQDAGADASLDGQADATLDALEAGADAADAGASALDGGRDGSRGDAGTDAGDATTAVDGGGSQLGVLFPGISPYVSVAPGAYDFRVVASAALGCGVPDALFPDTSDLPPLVAGTVETLAVVGDTTDQGTDPSDALVAFPDDTTVSSSQVALRFVNAVPSVVGVTFASGTITTATAVPYLSAAQFGGAGVDTDAGALDSNDYLLTAPISNAIWSLIDANGGTTTLVAVEGASVHAGRLATVVAVGGESGANLGSVGILLCTDTPPIVAGETATCELYEADDDPVCPSCP
jgi:hypothetical protein